MQRSRAAPSNSTVLPGPGLCGPGLEETLGLANRSGPAAGNQTLRCWLHLLSRGTEWELPSEGASAGLRVAMALVYALVCALGLAGNLLALCLLRSRHRRKRSSLTCFVMGLALTDLQFVLTLPFWAVDTALDFRWPFGKVMCKLVSSVTTMNMYASVFFLTAMSVARYCSVASAVRMRGRPAGPATARWASLGIWAASLAATLPHAIYSTTVQVSDEELCLVRFPDSGWDPQLLLGLYQTQKVLLGFVIPLAVISVCYLLLLRFVLVPRAGGPGGPEEGAGPHLRRRTKVTKSVAIVVLAFFVCWLPNQALTLWGALIKFDLLPFSKAFYNAQAYAFPLSVCLAHANSCLNPVLYCLVRREFRAGLVRLLQRAPPPPGLAPRRKKVAEAPPPAPAREKESP
ncbi:relaxin-3 receptor 1-like [Lepisosteus oculatus]|uniref:relaxin-3 receptor 1-like n=1 Tax=Lepisosteus oculatus TaxID=7918 RepID=UPI003718B2B8